MMMNDWQQKGSRDEYQNWGKIQATATTSPSKMPLTD